MGVIVPVGECVVIHKWSVIGDLEAMITTHGISGIGSYADETAAAVSIAALMSNGPSQAARTSNQYTYLGCEVARKQDDGEFTRGYADLTQVGTKTNAPVPNNSAVLITKRTASGGRKGKGRMYVPPFYPAEVNVAANGLQDTSIVTEQNTIWADYLDDLNTALGTDEFVLFHSDGSPSTPVTALVCERQLATQRRRMRS